jgi:sialic acid synthase SpsE
MTFTIADRTIGGDEPTYFIADIAANHDGDLDRAVELIRLAAEAGADAAKFQNFRAAGIVSDYGFKALGSQQSHQASWEKSVYDVYDDASIPADWTPTLKQACDEHGIHYFSAPYDFESIEMLDPFVLAYKVGSGDIDWLDSIRAMARKGKPMLVATGAASLADVVAAVEAVLEVNPDLCLMQCNTNYTADPGNMAYLNLRVLETYRQLFPQVVLGLSDHTAGDVSVLGAIALGARAVEKHFTDDTTRIGPDHKFSMDPTTWREMVDRARDLESALGSPLKKVEDNEKETVVLQRRCLRAAADLAAGQVLTVDDIEVLRPATPGALPPGAFDAIIGRTLRTSLVRGQDITWSSLD